MNSAVFREVFLAGGLVSLLLGAMFLSTGTFPLWLWSNLDR